MEVKSDMPEEKKKLEPTVTNKEESLADSKKIDLYINNESNDEQGISIMNVFSTLGKRFHVFVWVIIIGLLAGLLVPTLIYSFKTKKDSAIAIIGLDYENAEQGLAPDGKQLDISYLKSSYVVENALKKVTLSKKVSTAQVQSNLKIEGILTDETKQRLDILDDLKEAKNNDYSKILQNLQLQYRAQYIVSIGNVFKDGNRKFTVPSEDLSKLLNAVTASYSEYFIETYRDIRLPSNPLNSIGVDDIESVDGPDYLDILDEISTTLSSLESYCRNNAGIIPGFRSASGMSFTDLASQIATFRNGQIDYIYSYVYLNNVSKNKELQLTRYQYMKRQAELDLAEITTNIADLQAAITNYQFSITKVPAPDGTSWTEIKVKDDQYNTLVNRLTTLNEQKSALQERISILDERITKLSGPDATDEQKSNAKEYVTSAFNTANDLYVLASKNSQELFTSNAYQNKYMHTVVTSETEKFSDNMKMFLIGAGVGLGLGLVMWVADAFIIEFKNVKKANENKEAN